MKKLCTVVLAGVLVIPMAFAAEKVTTDSGLEYTINKEGAGDPAAAGHNVSMRYTGWLSKDGEKGEQFDTSEGRGPFKFTLGEGMVIKGWDEGVAGMKKGEERTLYVPADLGYGKDGIGPIPPNADLIFDVKLLRFK